MKDFKDLQDVDYITDYMYNRSTYVCMYVWGYT